MAIQQTGPKTVTPDMTPAEMRAYYIEETDRSLAAWEAENQDIRHDPPFPLEDAGGLSFTITPEVARRIKLRGQVDAFAKEAQVSTAGVRENQNVLCPWDHRYRINEYIFAVIAEALSRLVKDAQAERVASLPQLTVEEIAKRLGPDNQQLVEEIFGKPLAEIVPFVRENPVRIVGSEVRSNSPRYVELVSRIYAANGLYTLVMEGADLEHARTSSIFMWSFLTFVLGLSGGDYFTSSHGAPQKQSDKILGPDGSQYLPPLYMRIVDYMYRILEECETTGYTIKLAARDDEHLVRRLTYQNTARLYANYLRKGPASKAALELIEKASASGLRLKLDFFGGAGYRTISSIFKELGILGVFEGGFIRSEEDPFFHDIGFRVAEKKGQPGVFEVVHDSVDASLPQVVSTAGYDSLLADAPLGQVVFNVDPDVDRFVAGQVVSVDMKSELDALGVSYLPIGDDRVFAVFSPNQFFLMVADNDYEVARRDGSWEQYDNFDVHTYVSALAWDEWAERNGIPFMRVPVGFKEIAAILRQVETASASHPGAGIEVRNERGDVMKLGGRPKLHHAGEESGGRIGGPREPIYNVVGEGVIAMREKSSGETCLSAVSLMARLHIDGKIYLHRCLASIFQDYQIQNPMEFRGDIVHYNEAIVDPAALAAAKEDGIRERVEFNTFFRTLAEAYVDGLGGRLVKPLTLDELREILTESLPGMAAEWQLLDRIDVWSDGIQMWFRPGGRVRDLCLRPSGTDAKSKVYFDGTDKAYLKSLFDNYLRGFKPEPGEKHRARIPAGS